ncbi:response regulator [Silvanigrella paludirubra]|uniref:Response regulator n=1 Tax=Silvanigrella paludirubra TaxID=2499159 RepID=A0A6N6VVG1_9BACT|nr:response regulator [Silvanigrella paludirubra]KAB8037835.1 response regulator [Silvanigrella paludirubra]
MIEEFKNKAIAIIDDEIDILEVLKDMIKSHINVTLYDFNSPLKAIESLQDGFQPNIFLVDIKMPKMNGLDFIAKLKKMNIHKPIIVISGHAEKQEAIECLKLGAFNLLDKPLSFEILIHTILQALTLEEVTLNNETLNREKEILLSLFQEFTNKNEERVSEIENLVLEKTKLIQSDKNILKNFLERINECNRIDREIAKTYKDISSLLQKQNSVISRNISQEFFEKNIKFNKRSSNKQ